MSGIRIASMITRICAANDKNTDHDLCVFPVPVKLCSNMPHLIPKCFSSCRCRNHHTNSCRLFHLGGPSLRAIFGRSRYLGRCPSHWSNRPLTRGNRASRTPFPSLQEITPEDQDRTSNKNRRIGTNDNATSQGEGKTI